MLKLTKTLCIGLCASMLMFSCSKDAEDMTPSSTLSGVSTDAAKAASTNSFGFSNLRSTDGMTWSFDVVRVGDNTGANANTVMLALVGCDSQPIMLSSGNVSSLTMQKAGGPVQTLALSFLESSANACAMAATPGYVRFADFDGNVKDGSVYTFSVTLNAAVQVTSATVGVKAGNECVQGSMVGPGCTFVEDICGFGQGAFHKEGSWGGNTVVLGGHTYTEAEGLAMMNPNANNGNKTIGFAFSQGATVELNKKLGHISATAYASKMAAINTYLAGFDKLTETSAATLYDDSPEATAAKEAAGYIGNHIKCDVE
ncbi:hypothetical protein ACSX1A_12810 [Pontibacter sp. MBLB2868]|uniref:hypothetical protein n=1 Tax=Pontibacter sp. MBLB2868 TaxID=3451555 RepID=UPI003F753B85